MTLELPEILDECLHDWRLYGKARGPSDTLKCARCGDMQTVSADKSKRMRGLEPLSMDVVCQDLTDASEQLSEELDGE